MGKRHKYYKNIISTIYESVFKIIIKFQFMRNNLFVTKQRYTI